MLTLLAPAKINLVLEVLGKRDDGYHEIRSLVQTISLCDTLSFEPADGISLECDEPDLQTSDNLAIKAAELLKEAGDYAGGARIGLKKRIPWSAGLGGGSSDAAATLLALNELWKLRLKPPALVELAAKLGSDVPFFIHGGTVLMEGRGEKVLPLPASQPYWFVILVPPLTEIPGKTKQLYARLQGHHFTKGQFTERALESLSETSKIEHSLLFNVFDSIAIDAFPGIKAYWRCFEQAGARSIHLAGSGPALFAPADTESAARELHQRLYKQGNTVYLVFNSIPTED